MSFKEPFIAICRASDLEAAKRSGAVSDLIPKETLHDFVAFPPGMEDTIAALGTIYAPERFPHMHTDIRADVPEDFVAFTTVYAPDFQSTFRQPPESMAYILPKEDIGKLKAANDPDLTLCVSRYSPLRDEEEVPFPHTVHGMEAISGLLSCVTRDDEEYERAVIERVYLPGYMEKCDLKLQLGNETILALIYQNGRGDLATACPDRLPENLPERYKEAWRIRHRYLPQEDHFQYGRPTFASQTPGRLPSVEESRKNFPDVCSICKRAELPKATDKEWLRNATAYYTMYAMTEPSVDCLKDAVLCSIREMAKDGYSDAKIKSVLTIDDVHNVFSCHADEAVAVLKSREGKKLLHEVRQDTGR